MMQRTTSCCFHSDSRGARSTPQIMGRHTLPAVPQLLGDDVTRGLIRVPVDGAAATHR